MAWKSRDWKHQKQLNNQILGAKIQSMRWSTISRSVRRLSNKFHTCTFFAYNALSWHKLRSRKLENHFMFDLFLVRRSQHQDQK